MGNVNSPSAPDSNNPQLQQATEEPISGATAVPGAQPTLEVWDLITLGPATLTLTPRLSTIVGYSPTKTYIAILTDSAGPTVIVSSNGTAVSATMTNTSATVTMSRTGFEASITDEGRPSWHDSTGASEAAAATSSKAGAADLRIGDDSWTNVIMGIL